MYTHEQTDNSVGILDPDGITISTVATNKETTMSIVEKATVVVTEMKTTFSSGDSLILTYHNVKFYGYKEGYLYEVKYLERQEGKYGEDLPTPGEHHFMVSNTEYYPALNRDEAIKAFVERSIGLTENRTTKSHHLYECLEKEGKFKFGFNSAKISQSTAQTIPTSEEVLSKRESSTKLGDFLREKLQQNDEDRVASLLKRLDVYSTYKENWDGEGEKEVNAEAVSNAKKFVLLFPYNTELLSIAVGANGYVMIYSDLPAGYWEMVFTSESNTSFFSRKKTGTESFKEDLFLEEVTPKWFSENIEPLTVVPA